MISRAGIALMFGPLLACAAAPRHPAAGEAPPSAAGVAEGESGAAYERILGAFVVAPTGFVLLDPRTCEEETCGERAQHESVLQAAERTQVPAAIAASKLNLGALLWKDDDNDAAYQSIRSAQALFAEAGDAVGLALCHEWIGFMLLKSGEDELASDHLALAHQLYTRIGDGSSSERLIGYLE